MKRTMLSIAVGYISIAALNSFVHLVIAIYFKTDITLTGISFLPSTIWIVGITALQPLLGMFGGLLATTIAVDQKHLAALGLILLMIIIGFVDYSVLSKREPIWYLAAAPLLKAAGVFIGYKLQLKQAKTTTS